MRLLEGVRVVECAALFNGDRLGQLLGDLGADVIKVESPKVGDYLRDFGGQIGERQSPAHLQVNKNKRSLTLDFRRNEGREVFWRLIADADIVVDGFRYGALEKAGVGYEAITARRPEIVYCSYTGYGARGPYADIATHGQMMDALAGSVHVRIAEDGLVKWDKQRSTGNSVDFGGEGTSTGAAYAAMMVLAAYTQRLRTGEGAFLDVAAADAVVANAWIGVNWALNEHRVTDRTTVATASTNLYAESDDARYQYYATADDKIVLFCAIEPKFWANFLNEVNRPELEEWREGDADQPVDFATDERLRRTLADVFHTRTSAEWIEVARRCNVALGPVTGSAGELRDEPHFVERGLFVEGHHPHAGDFTYIALPGMVRGQQYEVRHHAPLLGEHTAEILTELGYDKGAQAELRANDII
ncbi:CaiB/BaiF CoA-transferase family protein [Arthrobacter sp. W4I7]|uniref:CaiB/BaiF CoA transferase family protein n=1 Tax=Arthrobacter sp. W4I7 TaxID=3042296 RepID=UPI002782CB0E|nr:CaiB/BaiF CoA-transferase family protein [Arthrobacter sp. W4I7]MDQ0691374.1 crotonobetainyl-CoA:carnitine CoA-transferase CaiB-like acyl-CoA transferase [Arthrobacter sp. W4I7]